MTYTALRLLLIAVPLVILLLLQVPWWLAAIIAAIVGLCLSYLLLGARRDAVSTEIYAARSRKARVVADDDVEDAVVDAASEPEREAEEKPVSESGDSGQLKN